MGSGARDGPRLLTDRQDACPRGAFADLPGEIRFGEPLSRYTTFHIGGPAWALFQPAEPAALVEAVVRARAHGLPWRLLGLGSNVLFPDSGFPGLVILTTGLSDLSQAEGLIWAGAGVRLSRLVRMGFPYVAGIPGTVGGAVVMNAGTKEGAIGDRVALVLVLSPDGHLRVVPGEEGGFGYRDSLFRRLELPVLGVALRAGRMPALLRPGSQAGQASSLSFWESLVARQATQPLGLPSAGCVFKNPKDAPPAGWLIDRAGLKGARVGDAVVSPRHANFICNLGHARASEVLALIDRIRRCVVKTFGVWLELEIDVVTA